ncbi:MAG: tyrosine-type recombinase/integrase [Verrucomicrobia bacterium]|nr:tyrosine-type recombinase/integrase [Verrucomicrobiota bacterium]MBU4291970.1 tyrosine-type recombinase/integrase [Verrucomicrobiota bacterium]MBU4429087.1 tyrosine-type recombinase/integrase [Verrucomicrobiota bacterium]MCG2680729.1 tyrosine-type recombinase/integrase [Kiritimatiellia bacterium]
MTKKRRTGNLYLRGNVYWLKYMVEGRLIRQSLDTTDRDEAETKQKEIMRQFTTADLVSAHAIVESQLRSAENKALTATEDANPPLAVADAWTAYGRATNRPDSSEAMIYRNHSIWKRFISWLTTEHPNKTAMRDIDPGAASAYAQRLTADQVTASTFNQHIAFMRLIWRCLAVPIRSAGNPWLTIGKKRLQRLANRRHTITPEQFANLLKSAGDADIHDLLFVLGLSGQRLVDGVMLRWDSIDFKRKVITLNPRKTARTGKTVFIPLLPALADLLQKRRDMVAGNLAFPELAAAYDRDSGSVSKRVQAVFTKAGLTTTEHRPGVERAIVVYGAHSLRHYFATQALTAGIPGEIVKRITGHSSDAMLEGYEHVDAAMIGKFAAKLSKGKPPAALPAHDKDILKKIHALAKKQNGKNWKTIRAAIMRRSAP